VQESNLPDHKAAIAERLPAMPAIPARTPAGMLDDATRWGNAAVRNDVPRASEPARV
jgi:hypothetical protein